MFYDIGLANTELLKSVIFVNEENYLSVIEQMSRSAKSAACRNLSQIFRNVDHEGNDYEPFPHVLWEMMDFSAKPYNIIKSIRVAGTMFAKGMDKQFWHLISDDLDAGNYAFVRQLAKISSSMCEEGARKCPSIWIFALLWKYLSNINKLPPANSVQEDNPNDQGLGGYFSNNDLPDRNFISIDSIDKIKVDKVEKSEKLYRYPGYHKCSDYFNIDVDHQNIRISEISDIFIESRLRYEDMVNFSSVKAKNVLHLRDLGTIQIVNVEKNENRAYSIYCWLRTRNDPTLRRYILKPYNTKQSVLCTRESDNLMCKNKYKYNWSNSSTVICLSEVIKEYNDNSRGNEITTKKNYYTISLSPPYIVPIHSGLANWGKSSLATAITLMDVVKFIYGVPNKNREKCGVYLYNSEPRIFSFDHDPMTDNNNKCINNDLLKKLDAEERKWISSLSQTIDKKFFLRISEILTLMG
jgi:hypothetical protein